MANSPSAIFQTALRNGGCDRSSLPGVPVWLACGAQWIRFSGVLTIGSPLVGSRRPKCKSRGPGAVRLSLTAGSGGTYDGDLVSLASHGIRMPAPDTGKCSGGLTEGRGRSGEKYHNQRINTCSSIPNAEGADGPLPGRSRGGPIR